MKRIVFLLAITFGLICCKAKHETEVTKNLPGRPAVVRGLAESYPSTDTETLQYAVSTTDVICPAVAQIVATYELLQGGYQILQSLRTNSIHTLGGEENQIDEDDFDDGVWHLTELPRAIYDYDGTIKYYEFGLIVNDELISTITVYAKREAPSAIAYMFPYVLPYENTEYDYFVGAYPHRYYFDGTGYLPVEEGNVNSSYIEVEMNMEGYWAQVFAQANAEELDAINTMLSQANTPDYEYAAEAADFWDNVDSAYNATLLQYVNMTAPCLIPPTEPEYNSFIGHLKDYLGTKEYCRDYTAYPYRGAALQQTFWWNIGCGVAALSWVYRGLYDTYPPAIGNYLPIHGDPSSTYFEALTTCSYFHYDLDTLDNLPWNNYSQVKTTFIDRSNDVDYGLAANFFTPGFAVKWNGSWEFALAPCHLNNAFKTATDDAFGVQFLTTSLVAADWIETNNLPVLIHADICAHYVVAYGYGGISETYGGDIQRKNLYFLVTDNGHEIKSNHYKPFWRRYKPCEYYYGINRID